MRCKLSAKARNIFWSEGRVNRIEREALNKHESFVLWLTGLSGSGKSTLAKEIEFYLHNMGVCTYILDGDNLRHGLNSDLGFSSEDRTENIRRVAEAARLFVDAGIVVISAFISPYKVDRQFSRSLFKKDDFVEVFVKCSLEECIKRDPKGLYKKALKGEIENFTGIDDLYEEPEHPEIVVETDSLDLKESLVEIISSIDYKFKRKQNDSVLVNSELF